MPLIFHEGDGFVLLVIEKETTTMNTKSLYRNAGLLLVIEGLLMFAPLIILGAAINWPESLSQPAPVVLKAIFEQAEATRTGYLSYLIYSVLFFPVIALTVRVALNGEKTNNIAQLALGFAALSTLARCIGIIRWLVAMPALAVAYNAAGVTPQTQEMLSLLYKALNDFGGSIGEILGVSIFAALAVFMVAVLLFRQSKFPRWIGISAVISALALLLPMVEIFGTDLGAFISVSVAFVQLWFLAVGGYLLVTKPQSA